MPLPNRPKTKMSLREFANVFTAASNARRESLYARNKAEHNRKKNKEFARAFKEASNKRRAALNARNAAMMYKPSPTRKTSPARKSSPPKLSSRNNAAFRAFFKKVSNEARR